jgi:Flp pilus assembly protein TadG
MRYVQSPTCSLSRRHFLSPDRKGAATVELAICIPVLLLISFSLIELCSMMFVKQGLTVAAYEAAHRAVQPTATSAQAIAAGQEILQQRRIQSGQVTINPGNIQQVEQGEFFTVTATAPATANRLVPFPLFTTSQLSATAVAMKEVPAQ